MINSSISLGDVTFGIMKTGANSSAPWHGHGIWAYGSGVELLFFSPPTLPSSPIITNCDRRAIYAKSMNVTLDEVNTQTDWGFFLENCRMNTVKITRNPLECRYNAIRTSNCLPVKSGSRIDDNDITMINSGNTAAVGHGILINEASQVTGTNATGWKITNNIISLDNTRWGIRYIGSNQTEMSRNEVSFTGTQYPHYVGFDLLNSNKLTLNCNRVFGSGSSTQKGYFVKNISQSAYTCNGSNSTSTGMEFSAMCDATVLKGSSFSGGTGLFLNGDVTLGTQGLDYFVNGSPVFVTDHGNKWSNSTALHATTQQLVVNYSKFGVDPGENVQFNPSNNWGSDWFTSEPTPTIPTFSCAGFSCLPQEQASTEKRTLEEAIADGSIHNSSLPGVIPKMLENHLYARLQENPSWASEPVYQQFLINKAGTATAAFWSIRQGIDALYNRTSTEQSAVEAAETDINLHRTALSVMDSTRNAGVEINETQYTQTLAQLASGMAGLRTQLNNIRAQRLTQATQLRTQNAAITTTEVWEYTEKKVNELAIRLFLQGDTLYAAQLATLDSIGSLCVHTNGEAVLRAQVLYNLFLEKEYTPVNCAGEREQQFLNVIADHVKISPNPTSGWIMLPDIDGVSRLIEVFDIAGRLVRSVNVSENELDLSDLGNGLYFLRVARMDNGAVGSAKVIVSK